MKYRSIFASSNAKERAENFESYWAYTQDHDGPILEAEKDLTKKKAKLASFHTQKVRSRKPLPDADLFYRNFVEWQDEPAMLDRKTLLLTCIYKFARHEWAGISEAWETIPTFGEAKTVTEKISRYHLCEEFCHVRLFHEMFRTFQLEEVEWVPFPKLTQKTYRMFSKFPEKVMSPPAFVSELMGMSFYLAVDRLLDSVFADEPEAKTRVRELLHEIMTDELAHIGQRRNYIGGLGIQASKLMVRPMITLFFRDIPEAKYLFDIPSMVREGLAFDYSQVTPDMIAKSWVPSYCRA
ncbi:MAG TPA: hypothetical protein VFW62_07510 [bacterium]|nr:hypothetical protein [bacterium]